MRGCLTGVVELEAAARCDSLQWRPVRSGILEGLKFDRLLPSQQATGRTDRGDCLLDESNA